MWHKLRGRLKISIQTRASILKLIPLVIFLTLFLLGISSGMAPPSSGPAPPS